MAATRTKTRPVRQAGAQRRRAPAKPAARAPQRRARQGKHGHLGRDLAAVGCLALAVFLAFVMYFGWTAGPVGGWLVGGLTYLVGVLAFFSPFLLAFTAYLLIRGPEKRPGAPVIAGVIVLCLALCLAAAADAFGLFGGVRPATTFQTHYLQHHGGAAGETLWTGVHTAVGTVGVDVLVLALLLAGVLLVSGTSLGLWADKSARGARAAGRAARRTASQTIADARDDARDFQERTAVYDSRPLATAAGTGATARFIDGASALPDIYATAPRVAGEHAGTAFPASITPLVRPAEGPARDDDAIAEQLTLADEADAADDPENALAFETPAERQWVLPDAGLVLRRTGEAVGESPAAIDAVSRKLEETLGHFGVDAHVVDTVSGPRVTRYEMQLAPGTKVSRVSSLRDDIAYALAATEIRVQAPIPGKSAVGVEVPNSRPDWVSLGDIYGEFPTSATPLSMWLGKDITGKSVLADLTRLVHVLIAGTTGSGKSACINSIVTSILLRATPDEVRFILIDPKKVELSHFDGVPHLLAPVVTNIKNAGNVLANIVREMERRYEFMLRTDNAQNLRELNRKLARTGEKPLPYIVVVMDELADLMMVAPAEVEHAVIRLGQLGRAVGIHLVVATQRPSVDVVTGLIKTNIPSRIGFKVASQTDSRVILDMGGAESLLGDGDMLFHPYTSSKMLRVQGAFVSPEEMKLITEHWRAQAAPEFREDLLESATGEAADQAAGTDEDALLPEAVATVVRTGAASVALLQRRLRVGYARAGRLIDIMEERGIISGFDGSKARKVLIDEDDLPRILGTGPGAAPAAEPQLPVPTLRDEVAEQEPTFDDEYVREPFDE
jgi:S-DNA-T family DNA segregation ATPase FtsK/SpoIIIE